MKSLILVLLLNTLTFSNEWNQITEKKMDENYAKFLKENKKRYELMQKMYRVFTCTPFQETGIFWGINKVIGGEPITISVQKTEMSSIIIGKSKINKIGQDRFEDSTKRIYLKDYTPFTSPSEVYLFNVNTITIDTKNKTIWYNCIFDKEETPQ